MSRSSVRELPVFVIGESKEISVNWPGSRGNGVESRVLVLEDYVVFFLPNKPDHGSDHGFNSGNSSPVITISREPIASV